MQYAAIADPLLAIIQMQARINTRTRCRRNPTTLLLIGDSGVKFVYRRTLLIHLQHLSIELDRSLEASSRDGRGELWI